MSPRRPRAIKDAQAVAADRRRLPFGSEVRHGNRKTPGCHARRHVVICRTHDGPRHSALNMNPANRITGSSVVENWRMNEAAVKM